MKMQRHEYFFRELISFASVGFNALSEEIQEEVRQFILSQQCVAGGFSDRAGNADPYYSLFGFFLAEATGLKEVNRGLRSYVEGQRNVAQKSLVNSCCLSVIEKEMNAGIIRRLSGMAGIMKGFLSSTGRMDRSYQYFMIFMALDGYGLNTKLTRTMVRPFLLKTKLNDNTSCPLLAAITVLKLKLNIDASTEQRRIMEFFDEEKGFKAFKNSHDADLLSTAVALVSLKMANSDFRIVRHTCLRLIQENYHDGAFIAGNDDRKTDTEYTFYGLLALGILANTL